MVTVPWYAEWASSTILSVVETATKKRYWFDHLDQETKNQALTLPRFDVNRGHFVKVRKRT